MDIDAVITQRDYLDYTKQVHSYSNAISRLVELSHSYITDAEEAHRNGTPAIWANGFW